MLNYVFRSALGMLHFVVAYFTYHETSEATRAHDKYVYVHAVIVVVSIGVEVAMSTFVKIKRRQYHAGDSAGIEVRDSLTSPGVMTSEKKVWVTEDEREGSGGLVETEAFSTSAKESEGLRESLLTEVESSDV